MRRMILAAVAAVIFAVSLTAAARTPQPAPQRAPAKPELAFWVQKKCSHGHNWASAKRGVRAVMHSPRPLTERRGRRAWHYAKCTKTRADSRLLSRGGCKRVRCSIPQWRAWRKSYPVKWRHRWLRLSLVARNWTRIVSWKESRNRRVAPEGGFLSYFQWLLGTWRAACRCAIHPYKASWHHQAVVAWFWHLSHPRGQWPNTGE